MAIGRTFEESLMKAIRSLEVGVDSLELKGISQSLSEDWRSALVDADDERLFVIAETLRRGYTLAAFARNYVKSTCGFCTKSNVLVQLEQSLRGAAEEGSQALFTRHRELLRAGEKQRLSGRVISRLTRYASRMRFLTGETE